MDSTPVPSRVSIWILAARPKTLWASVAPVIVGTGIAFRDGHVHWLSALAALLGAVFIQIGTNLANDLFDHMRGADTADRVGPLRVTQSGLATPRQVRLAMILAFGVAFLIGVYLVSRGGWPIVILGVCSIAAAVLYTGGPYPFGYYGWGDLFVFIFFGPVAVVGTYYVQTLSTTSAVWVASIPMGALATAILIVNNLRDIETDSRSGKRTLAVRLGRFGSVGEYVLMLVIAIVTPLFMFLTRVSGVGVLASSVVAIAFIPLLMKSLRTQQQPMKTSAVLNDLLAQTARVKLVYAIAFAVGINL
jgi:1,4-dihydroxy-2-naphthoate octaprenyltransferase